MKGTPTPPTPEALVARMRSVPLLARVPDEELLWLATEGRWERYEAGETLIPAGVPVTTMFFVLSGSVVGFVGEGAKRRRIVERHAGEFTGVVPFSRLVSAAGEVLALDTVEAITLSKARFPEMLRACYELVAVTVHVMVDRARHYNAAALHDEKMISLGKLAAGLAHELNNPASAIARSADDLGDRLDDVDGRALALAEAGFDREQLAELRRVRDRCLDGSAPARSPMERADREDALLDWLDDRGIDAELAYLLTETPIALGDLDALAEALATEQLATGLAWLAHSSGARALAYEIGEGAERIHTLVGSVKGFTDMDRAAVAEPVDVAVGLASTLAMLESRVRERDARVVLDLPPDLPPVRGFVGDLNQVWMNLLDNALDAIPEGGRVEVDALAEGERLVVRIRDDGPGIPDDVLPKIFDPFFTTKGVGEGTGLGLDIVRRLVEAHEGAVQVESGSEGTTFRVGLPLAE